MVRCTGARVLRQEISGKYANRIIEGGVGHNLPQESPAPLLR
jgi:hypothetical protein